MSRVGVDGEDKKTLWQGLFGISPYEHPPKGSVGRSLPLLVEMFSV
jgi:hypothetical protein